MKPISYEANGFPEFLRSENACRKAIERGVLTPDTPVIAYADGGQRERMTAGEHPLLGPMFAKDEPEPAAVPAPPPPPEPPVAAEPAATAAAVPASRAAPPSEPAPPEPAPPEPAPPIDIPPHDVPPPREGTSKVFWIFGGLLVLAVAISQLGGNKSADPAEAEAAAAEVSEAASAAPEIVETLYAVREVAIRSGPSAGSSRVALLPRETPLTGVQVPSQSEAGYFWLRLTQGEYAGNYVSMVNLSVETRPTLNTANAGFWYTSEALTPLEAPSDSAAPKSDAAWKLPAGAQVDVAGVTGAGIFNSGWAEVMLDKQSGVGYVPMDRLTRESPAAAAATAAAADADSAPTMGLRLTNKCSNRLSLLLRYTSTTGWATVSATIEPGVADLISYGGEPIQLTSKEVYFMVLPKGSGDVYATGTGDTAQFNGRTYRLARVNLDTGSDEYYGNFTC